MTALDNRKFLELTINPSPGGGLARRGKQLECAPRLIAQRSFISSPFTFPDHRRMTKFEFLGPYRIGEPLGRGGMGSVFSAVHEKTGEKVAVKLIAQHVADEPRFRRRFEAEVKTLQRLQHKNIVRLIGYGEEAGQLFYSMELVEGEPLQARIRREKRLDWRVTMDIAIDVCAALKHAHDIGVVHRDLKPANLILGKDDAVKLVDFGIAKIFGGSEHTAAGSMLGTADYMAPEQATSRGTTARTDLYALGSLMYAMLTGRPPFTGKKITEVIESLKRDRPVPLDLVNPELPEELVELVHDLLEKAPEDRPPTALAVMNRLKAMRAGLQREKTIMGDGDGLQTEVGGSNPDTSPSGIGAPDASTGVIDKAGKSPRKRTIVSRGGDATRSGTQAAPIANPSDATVASAGASDQTVRPDGSVSDREDTSRTYTGTHFQTVDGSSSTSGVFEDYDSQEESSSITHWLSIAGMIAFLVFGAGLFLYSIIPPNADQLHAEAAEGDTGAMKTFIRRFPGDPRADEIRKTLKNKELNGVINRLDTTLADLTAAESAFLFVMQGREQYPKASSIKIRKWLDVYDAEQTGEKKTQKNHDQMVELAKFEADQLEARAPKIILSPQAEELIQRIRDAVKLEDPEQTRKILQGIIDTSREDWAEPAREEAQVHLDLLNEFAGEVDPSE